MLVKLLKNDYYNRGKTLLFLCASIIVDAFLLHFIYESELCNERYGAVGIVFTLVMALGFIILYISFPALLFYSVSDFGKRYFKDQGYFTHTLPVKTSVLLMARMVADVINTIIITITYLIVGSVMADDYSVIKNIISNMGKLYSDREVTAGEEMLAFFLRTLVFLLGVLFVLWQYNAAYSAGHMYNNGKKIKSFAFFFAFYVAEVFLLALITEPVGDIFINGNMDVVEIQLFELVFWVVLEIIGIVSMGMITHSVCKKNLNLE